jgi:hypothetical protein
MHGSDRVPDLNDYEASLGWHGTFSARAKWRSSPSACRSVLRVRVSDGKVEQLASLRTVRRYLGHWGFWSGLTPGNALLLSRDASKSEVYKFDWRLP